MNILFITTRNRRHNQISHKGSGQPAQLGLDPGSSTERNKCGIAKSTSYDVLLEFTVLFHDVYELIARYRLPLAMKSRIVFIFTMQIENLIIRVAFRFEPPSSVHLCVCLCVVDT
jgi:hypothetical protein